MSIIEAKEFILDDSMKLLPIGLGTYGLNGREGVKATRRTVKIGYRLLDSAFNYESGGAVGETARASCVPRNELTITSKLPGRHQKYRGAPLTIEESLYRGGLDYYDIYLIHWPNPKTGLYVEAWQAMIKMRKRGMVRSIGMCNFLPEYLERLTKETGVTPSINQIELHPHFNQGEQRGWDAAHDIVNESWNPLGHANNVLQDPMIGEIVKAHGKSISQVILRWHVQLDVLLIPRLSDPARQKEDLEVFDFVLSEEGVQKIRTLSRPDGQTADRDPSVYEEF